MRLLHDILCRAQIFPASRMAKQAAQMTVLRFIGLGIGAVAQIYATRQLGPEKLGISGMALATVAQGSILVTLGANTLLVREYKEAQTEEQRTKLISAAFTLRTIITAGLGLVLLAALPWLWPYPEYLLATACVLPLIFFENNQALWVLQAKERVHLQFCASLAGTLVSAILIFAFIRPLSPTGSDMLVAVAGAVVVFGLSWCFAHRTLPGLKLDWDAIGKLAGGTKWLFLSAIVTYGYTRFDQPMVGWFRSGEEMGVYRSAWQITNALQPFLTIASLLLYPKLISWKMVSPIFLWQQQRRISIPFAGSFIIASSLIWIAIPPAYPYIYGDAFAAAAIPCAILLTARLVAVVNVVYGYGLWAMGKDKLMLSLMTLCAVASISANLWVIPNYGIIGAALINLFSEVFVLLGCIVASIPKKPLF